MNITKELAIFNRVTFVEHTHSYLIDGQPANKLSVTKVLKTFKKEFDKHTVAARVAKRMKTTTEAVLADWGLGNLYSTTIGSMLHKYIENFYCNKRVEFEGDFGGLGFDEKKKIGENLPKLIGYFQNFYNENAHLLCVKTEIVLGDVDDTRVCGMSDLLCYNTNTDELEILDFKTNKKMEKKSPYGNLFFPFDDMSEGEINEYTIQLNTYKYFVEKYTNLKIGKLKIVWFNVVNDNYKIFELEDIQPKIKLMFERFKSASLFEEQ
jgi:hypothetical protein